MGPPCENLYRWTISTVDSDLVCPRFSVGTLERCLVCVPPYAWCPVLVRPRPEARRGPDGRLQEVFRPQTLCMNNMIMNAPFIQPSLSHTQTEKGARAKAMQGVAKA